MDLKERGWKVVAWIVVGHTPVVCSCEHSNEVHETGKGFHNTENMYVCMYAIKCCFV